MASQLPGTDSPCLGPSPSAPRDGLSAATAPLGRVKRGAPKETGARGMAKREKERKREKESKNTLINARTAPPQRPPCTCISYVN